MATPMKSIQELKRNGTYRPNKHGTEDTLVTLPVEAPECPLRLNDEAMRYFDELVDYGLEMDAVSKADGIIVALMASEFQEWLELDRLVKSEGVLKKMPTATGFMQEVVNPHLKLRDDKLKVILRILGELGLTPVARSRLQVNQKATQEKSALGQFLAAI